MSRRFKISVGPCDLDLLTFLPENGGATYCFLRGLFQRNLKLLRPFLLRLIGPNKIDRSKKLKIG